MDPDGQLERLRGLSPTAELWSEGGKAVAFLPKLHFRAGAVSMVMDALLWPHARDGYDTRLFLERRVEGKGANWRTANLFGRTWHVASWGGVPANLPWVEILSNHLRAFQ